MNKTEQIIFLLLLATGISAFGGRKIPEINRTQTNYERDEKKLGRLISVLNDDFSEKKIIIKVNLTPSQAAVDSVMAEDFRAYSQTGKGLYIGRPVKHPKGIKPKEIKGKYVSIDCYNALEIVLKAEIPNKIKSVFAGSKDGDGNFSAPFMVKYLIEKEGWEAYAYYDEKNTFYKNLKRKGIIDEDLIINTNKSGRFFYRSGGVNFLLTNFITKTEAKSLLEKLTFERGYAIGFQRDGTHCYSLVQRGMFEIHLNSFPLGYDLNEEIKLRPLHLHEGEYLANSSVAVFAFPPRN